MDKLEEIKNKISAFQAKSAAKDEIKAFTTLVIALLKKSKENFDSISSENVQKIQDAIEYISTQHSDILDRVSGETNSVKKDVESKLQKSIKQIQDMCEDLMLSKPKDGKDADEEKIVEDVLSKIKLPEYEVFTLEDRGKEIVDEINALPTNDNEFKIDASHIKNLPEAMGGFKNTHAVLRSITLNELTDVVADNPSTGQVLMWNGSNWVNDNASGGGGGSTYFIDQTPTDGGTYPLLQGTIDGANQLFTVSEGQYITEKLIVMLNGQVLSQGSEANEYVETNPVIGTFTLNTAPSGTDELMAMYVTTAGGGGGSAAGADTQVQFNDAGDLNGDTTFTFNKTSNELTVATVLVDDEVYGAGWNGDLSVPTKNAIYDKIESMGGIDGSGTANEITYWVDSDTLGSLAVATYPSLTELARVKGVTSAIQTQLDAKQPLDSDLTTIAGLTATTDNFIVSVASAWASRTPAQVRTTLGLGTAALVATDLADLNESTIEAAIDTLANLTSIQGFTVTLADAGADAILGWDDSAGAYENLTQAEVLAVIGDSSDTAKGVVELAIASEVTTGTDTTRAVTADAFSGSDYGKRVVNILVSDPTGSAITTGDGKACFRVPSVMNGWNLVGVAGSLSTVSSSGLPTFQIRRSRRTNATTRSDADMLSTKLSIDASEFDSVDATTAVVIDTSNDDVNTGDNIYIDIDVAGTGAKGLVAELIFQLP